LLSLLRKIFKKPEIASIADSSKLAPVLRNIRLRKISNDIKRRAVSLQATPTRGINIIFPVQPGPGRDARV